MSAHIDQIALDAATAIMAMYFEPIPGMQLKAKIQCAVRDAMNKAQLARIEPAEPVAWRIELEDSQWFTDDLDEACDDLTNEDAIAVPLYAAPQPIAQPAPSVPDGWQPIETAQKNMVPRLYLVGRHCVQGFVDATGELMVQSEVSPHWRKMRGKPSHWMPLPAAPKNGGGDHVEG